MPLLYTALLFQDCRLMSAGNELARIKYLFGFYEQYTAPMYGINSKK